MHIWPIQLLKEKEKDMKQLITTTLLLLMMSVNLQAQEGNNVKFSPEKFDADLQAFIIKEANLTQQEAAAFVPVYKEMREKQHQLFERQRKLGRDKPQDEKACQKTIRERDAIDLEQKRVQQTYHERFLEVLPASKVYDLIKAEDRFHRRMMRNWGQGGQKTPGH